MDTHTSTYVRMYVHTHTHTHTHTHFQTMFVCQICYKIFDEQTFTQTHFVNVFVCACVCVCLCVFVHANIFIHCRCTCRPIKCAAYPLLTNIRAKPKRSDTTCIGIHINTHACTQTHTSCHLMDREMWPVTGRRFTKCLNSQILTRALQY